ncbi:ADP-ribosylation factor-like protein 16 [Anthonomus grandis grandis]|uniref:ADP-ribosylation factor-like protein 16 n=1 Tax=Anthonomus grandis grandis TaxID=2921223 RepID=UPI002166A2C1|nr:ADP-ribosylation factor-like protein 16 [Anthonomus grandis grandis]
MVLCIGPKGSGKTLLIRKIQNPLDVDETTSTVPTMGTNISNLLVGDKLYEIRELGGGIAPIWSKYFQNVGKVMFVIDTSNLCQISEAGVLLYTVLVHPLLQRAKFLLVLSKMDHSYRQMRNEALLMLQMKRLQKEIKQKMTIVEASAITGEGREEILKWITEN